MTITPDQAQSAANDAQSLARALWHGMGEPDDGLRPVLISTRMTPDGLEAVFSNGGGTVAVGEFMRVAGRLAALPRIE